MENLFLNGWVLEMLEAFGKVANQLGIDFFLVGALARDLRLYENSRLASKRMTRDVDIAILLASEDQFYEVKEGLLATGDFAAHEREAIKLIYRQAIEVDLLPFGQIENLHRETRIEKPRPFIMDVPGFGEVLPDVEQVTVEGLTIRVCSMEGIVLLKIIANADNPSRTKDITDIEHIINVYFELNEDRIYGEFNDMLELYDASDMEYLRLVSARVIGRIMGRLLTASPALRQRVLDILQSKSSGRYWSGISAGIAET
ncbi:MAG TPA: nucleotidyl transferase AbiEii/AbiGii toxin family protein [Puia sp.]|nr:nucleotidyl transferase AbiEii/AbiGii toxin family protein [Puia sp.]